MTLAWTHRYVRVEGVRTAVGWEHRVHQESRQKLAVLFTDGTSCAVFTAGLREDGLHTDVHRRDCHDEVEPKVETFPVGDIGKVTLAWTRQSVRVQEVASADGWRHRVHQEHRREVVVGFTDGEACVVFTAVLGDDGLRTHVERHRCDRTTDQRPTDQRPTDERPTDERPTDQRPTDQRPTDERPDGTDPVAGDAGAVAVVG